MNIFKYLAISVVYWMIFYYIPNTNGILLPAFILAAIVLYTLDVKATSVKHKELLNVKTEDIANHITTIISIVATLCIFYLCYFIPMDPFYVKDEENSILCMIFTGFGNLLIVLFIFMIIALLYMAIYCKCSNSILSKWIQIKIEKK